MGEDLFFFLKKRLHLCTQLYSCKIYSGGNESLVLKFLDAGTQSLKMLSDNPTGKAIPYTIDFVGAYPWAAMGRAADENECG